MTLFKIYKSLCAAVSAPVYLHGFLSRSTGAEYQVGLWQKLKLIWQFKRNHRRIQTASHWMEHLEMAAAVLRIPAAVSGDVIECGCFKGGSTANLSLVCALVGRKLIVCDSFEGLPEPAPEDVEHLVEAKSVVKVYEKGQFTGRLEEVKSNVARFGSLPSCEFIQGYFEDSLHKIDRPAALIYVDVDLHSSLRTCLRYLWPKLVSRGILFSHEAQDLPYVALFFDKDWWRDELGTAPPGFVGSGSGVRVGLNKVSGLGYAVKRDQHETVARVVAT